jgi:hypothetical protein
MGCWPENSKCFDHEILILANIVPYEWSYDIYDIPHYESNQLLTMAHVCG